MQTQVINEKRGWQHTHRNVWDLGVVIVSRYFSNRLSESAQVEQALQFLKQMIVRLYFYIYWDDGKSLISYLCLQSPNVIRKLFHYAQSFFFPPIKSKSCRCMNQSEKYPVSILTRFFLFFELFFFYFCLWV